MKDALPRDYTLPLGSIIALAEIDHLRPGTDHKWEWVFKRVLVFDPYIKLGAGIGRGVAFPETGINIATKKHALKVVYAYIFRNQSRIHTLIS